MKNSLGRRLLLGLSLATLLIWSVASISVWQFAKADANEVFDAQQVLLAKRLAASDLKNLLKSGDFPRGGFNADKRHYDDDALAFAIFTAKGERVLSDGDNGDNFIFEDKIGFSEGAIVDDDDSWRIFWQPAANGNLRIAVGQEMEYREEMVGKLVFGQLGVWLLGLPVLLLVTFYLIRQALLPINQLSKELANRKASDLSRLDSASLPQEIQPLVTGFNQFLVRTEALLARERQFISDAAHELRSPLAGLRIQTEVAQLAGENAEMRETALQHLTQGIDRATLLVEQLLMLSRLEHQQNLENQENIDWAELLQSLVAERERLAAPKHIKLSLSMESVPKTALGQVLLLQQMVGNLIDNAIKYCPEGSEIRVILATDKLIVADNGNGVAPAHLKHLGQRFYRLAGQNEKGSGLGLSIVKRIAALHQYHVYLENIETNGQICGFRAVISF